MTVDGDLKSEVAGYLSTYLKKGEQVNLDSFTESIDPTLNVDNVEKLLRTHFVLETTSETNVLNFVKNLPSRLRNLKTTVTKETEVFHGSVQGRIDWGETIATRYATNPTNKQRYACAQRSKNYDIPENIVLKELLTTIQSILNDELKTPLSKGYDWVSDWKHGPEQTLENIQNNVYLRRISHEDQKITPRMIQRAKQSRQSLYSEAAELLTKYQRLMNHDVNKDESEELLQKTMIEPGEDTFFELYWAFKLIDTVDNKDLQLLTTDNDSVVATWHRGQHKFTLYHDATGNLTFEEPYDQFKDDISEYLERRIKALAKQKDLTGGVENLWGGRPDILIEKQKEDGEIDAVFVGEVKNTENTKYAKQGLKGLLEYIALRKDDESDGQKYY